MAIYRIFPDADTFIFTENVTGNAGLDEINEIGGYPVAGIGQSSRLLIKFKTSDIQNVINNKIGNRTFQSKLHLYLASAYELPQSYSLFAYPVYDSWKPGVGKYGDVPVDTSGVSWSYPQGYASVETKWSLPSNGATPTNVTGSYPTSGSLGYGGGGAWYTGSNGLNLEAEQVFQVSQEHDVDINITNAVKLHYSQSISNNGYIVKLNDDLEFNTTSSIRLKYYSADTNTIYPPYLEFQWDDSVYSTGSLSILSTDQSSISITNNKGKYVDEGKQRFRLKARPKYPTRSFTTSSAYTVNYALPTASYWGLRDEFTEEMIIPFNTGSTKISCDSTGPFFDIYMDGLQPERYYRILIKTELDGTNTVVDNNSTFKVVRNG
jgi:hypothetical protein